MLIKKKITLSTKIPVCTSSRTRTSRGSTRASFQLHTSYLFIAVKGPTNKRKRRNKTKRGARAHGEKTKQPSAMAVGGLKLDARLLALVSSVWTIGLIVTVYGISKSGPDSEKLIDFKYLAFLFRQINPYMFAAMGIAAAIGFSVLGAAWCVRAFTRILPSSAWARARAHARARVLAPERRTCQSDKYTQQKR